MVTKENKSELYQKKNEVKRVGRHYLMRDLLILFACGMLFAAAFPDLNWGALGWVGLIPLYWMVKEKRAAVAALYGFCWGYGWSVTSFFWLREIEFFIPYIMAAVLACFPMCWACLVPVLKRGLLIPVSVQLSGHQEEGKYIKPKLHKELIFIFGITAWWVILEWIRCWIFTGLPWNYIAVTQWQNLPLLQICEFTGIYGVSFIVVLLNIAFAQAINGWYMGFKHHDGYKRPYPFIICIIILAVSVISGYKAMTRYAVDKKDPEIVMSVLQGDIPQMRHGTTEQALFALNTYLDLSRLAVVTRPDIVLWPETAVPYPFFHENQISQHYQKQLFKIAKEANIPFLIGSLDFGQVPPGQDPYSIHHNSALLVGTDNKVLDRFHKVHRVPFGEFVPFGEYFPWLVDWIGMGRDLTPGKEFNAIEPKPGVRFGVNICFEDVFPYVSRNLVKNGANLLVVLTNDAWYPKSSEPDQHLANSIFRAIENRRPMVRCGNNSCSCVILPNGYIADSIFEDTDPKTGKIIPNPVRKGRGFANFKVKYKKDPPLTFYTKYGDVFIYFCILIFAITVVMTLVAWREKKQALIDLFD